MGSADVRLLTRQVRYQLLQFVRIPVALFFTLLLPLLMLLLFNSLFAGDDAYVDTPAGRWPLQQFYVGSLAAFTAVSSTFTNLANTVPIRRQEGILEALRGARRCATGCTSAATSVRRSSSRPSAWRS